MLDVSRVPCVVRDVFDGTPCDSYCARSQDHSPELVANSAGDDIGPTTPRSNPKIGLWSNFRLGHSGRGSDLSFSSFIIRKNHNSAKEPYSLVATFDLCPVVRISRTSAEEKRATNQNPQWALDHLLEKVLQTFVFIFSSAEPALSSSSSSLAEPSSSSPSHSGLSGQP